MSLDMDSENLPKTTSDILMYQTEDGQTRLDVRVEDETVWLTQAALAELFQTTPQNITLHIKNVFDEEELNVSATCKDYLQVRREGTREVERWLKHYNLDMILAVGYRVRSHRGTQFRRWATERLREYLVKGFTMPDGSVLNTTPVMQSMTALSAQPINWRGMMEVRERSCTKHRHGGTDISTRRFPVRSACRLIVVKHVAALSASGYNISNSTRRASLRCEPGRVFFFSSNVNLPQRMNGGH